jgi:hypothetical protein
MSRISAEDAFRVLAKWGEERAAIRVQVSRPAMKISGQSAASRAILERVLSSSAGGQKALLTLHDENGDAVAVTVSLEGAEWEASADTSRVAATFPNGSRYVFDRRL